MSGCEKCGSKDCRDEACWRVRRRKKGLFDSVTCETGADRHDDVLDSKG